VKDGKLRALAVTSATRSSAAPDIPTVSEAGVPDYEATAWFGLFAPAGTPADVIAKLSHTVAAATQAPEVRAALEAVGCEPMGTDPEAFGAFFKSQVNKWAKVVAMANV